MPATCNTAPGRQLSERERTNRAIKDTWQRLVEQNPQMLTQANVKTQRQQELQQHQAMWPPVRAPSLMHVCTSLPPVSPVFTHPPQHLAAGQAYVQATPPPVQQVQRTVQQVRQAQQAAQARAQVPESTQAQSCW